jgi:hypothetical protein
MQAAELVQGAGLDLADAFLRHAEVFAHFLQRLRAGLLAQAEAAPHDLALAH